MLRRRLITLLALLAAGGCGSEFDVVPVSGRVTLDGEPLPECAVLFQPIAPPGKVNAGPGSTATTDADGRYTLTTVFEGRKGAVVGEHRVILSTGRDIDESDMATIVGERVPARYQDGSLTITVPAGGTDQADFELTTQ
jgi:hypothetical protein